MDKPQRKYGFPLLMLLGFGVGAVIATVTIFILSAEAGQFNYLALWRLVVPLGALGAYVGHVVGAARCKEAGFAPFGPLTPGVLAVGAAIVLLGSLLVMGSVFGIMTLIKGPPPH